MGEVFLARIGCLRAFDLCSMVGVDLDGRGSFCPWTGRLGALLMGIGAFGVCSAGRYIRRRWPSWAWVLMRGLGGYN